MYSSSHAGQITFSIDVDGWASFSFWNRFVLFLSKFFRSRCYFLVFFFYFSNYSVARSHSDFLFIASFTSS